MAHNLVAASAKDADSLIRETAASALREDHRASGGVINEKSYRFETATCSSSRIHLFAGRDFNVSPVGGFCESLKRGSSSCAD